MYVFIVLGTPAERIPYQIVEENQIWSFQLMREFVQKKKKMKKKTTIQEALLCRQTLGAGVAHFIISFNIFPS